MQVLDVFISHSSVDEPLAERLVTLIRSALNLPTEKIRCTSLNGFRLPVGISTNDRLRQEIHDSKVFIALITPSSLQSTYVLFELGARWGTQKPLIPLLACGMQGKKLPDPLSTINALSCAELAQLHQFIIDLGRFLGVNPDSAAAYQKCMEELIEKATQHVSSKGITLNNSSRSTEVPNLPSQDPELDILKAMFELEDDDPYEYGHKAEKIAAKSGMKTGACRHYLENLVKDSQVKKNPVSSSDKNRNGTNYSLTTKGSGRIIK